MLNVVFKKKNKCYRFYEITNCNIWVTRTDKNGDVWLIETLFFDDKTCNQKQFILNKAKKYGLVESDIILLYPNQQQFDT